MSQTWGRDPRALWRRSGERIVVLGNTEEPQVLTGPGPILWDLLTEPVTEADLVTQLAALYSVDTDTVAADVAPFLAELARTGVIRSW